MINSTSPFSLDVCSKSIFYRRVYKKSRGRGPFELHICVLVYLCICVLVEMQQESFNHRNGQQTPLDHRHSPAATSPASQSCKTQPWNIFFSCCSVGLECVWGLVVVTAGIHWGLDLSIPNWSVVAQQVDIWHCILLYICNLILFSVWLVSGWHF